MTHRDAAQATADVLALIRDPENGPLWLDVLADMAGDPEEYGATHEMIGDPASLTNALEVSTPVILSRVAQHGLLQGAPDDLDALLREDHVDWSVAGTAFRKQVDALMMGMMGGL